MFQGEASATVQLKPQGAAGHKVLGTGSYCMATTPSEIGARQRSHQCLSSVSRKTRPRLNSVNTPDARKTSARIAPLSAPLSKAIAKRRSATSRPDKNRRSHRPLSAPLNTQSSRTYQRLYQQLAAPVGFVLVCLAVTLGWIDRDVRKINPEEGLGYALGIVSVVCMLVLLVYPLRKRLKILAFLGTVKNWFRTHMLLGVLSPLAALYHCNFQLGSLNSQIALYSALLVAGSGLVGRFLYRKIHQGLYGRKTDLKKMRVKIGVASPTGSRVMKFLPQLMQRIRGFDQEILKPEKGILASLVLLPRLSYQTRREYTALIRFAKKRLALEARLSPVVAQHERRLIGTIRHFVANHMLQVRRIAKLHAYDRLFALWHVAHLPFFFLLVVTATIHVFAVHLY